MSNNPTHATVYHAPHNQDARLPNNVRDWPSSLIVDAFYGCAAIRKWGVVGCVKLIQNTVHFRYYDTSLDNGESDGSNDKNHQGKSDSAQAQAKARQQRTARRAAEGTGDSQAISMADAMDLLLSLWRQVGTRPQQQYREPDQHDKVLAWLQKTSN
jgi:hypothetical protein